jgi:polyisoprenoid-binding protein YceI
LSPWHSSSVRVATISLLLLALAPFGCPDKPAEDQAASTDKAEPAPEPAERETSDTTETTSPEPEGAQAADGAEAEGGAEALTADLAQSKVGFAVARAPIGHIGHFERYSATLELAGDQPQKLDIAVKTASVVADRKGLTSHLKSADFFDVDKYPTATFTTEEIVTDPETGPNAFVVRGTMHLHGVGRKLEFPATIDMEAGRVVGRATLDISAKAFGIAYEGMEEELAEDAVQLEIELVFPRVANP